MADARIAAAKDTLARRGFLTGLIGLVAAPAIVRFEALMPVRMPLVLPTPGKRYWEVAWSGPVNYDHVWKVDGEIVKQGGLTYVPTLADMGKNITFEVGVANSFQPGDTVQLAVDLDKRELWHRTKHA
jgi:hypothetical protein